MDVETALSQSQFGNLKRFPFEDLSAATDAFSPKNLLGEGSFAFVYKGVLADGRTVAIKRVKEEKKGAGELMFINEIDLYNRAVHKNLLRIEGYCFQSGESCLVFPFMKHGSVASSLQGLKPGESTLPWTVRHTIAIGTAEGLSYMHNDCHPKLIHRDIKAANVLLNDVNEAVIGDFGLAKQINRKDTHASTAVKGTMGHIAPEYFLSGQTSAKTDVFAYGVFLLELVSGRDVYKLTLEGMPLDLMLRDWVLKLMQEERYGDIVDPNLDTSQYSPSDIVGLLKVAVLCMQGGAAERPNMAECATMLQGTGLAERWEGWQADAVDIRVSDLLSVIKNDDIWSSGDSGISWDAFEVELLGPR